MNEEMRMGMLLAYQSVFEEISTIKAELRRKGIDEPKGFSLLEGFVEDNIRELNIDSVKLDKRTVAAILDIPSFVLEEGAFNESEWNNFISTRIRPLYNAIEQEKR